MTHYTPQKRDLYRYQTAEEAFTSEGGRLAFHDQRAQPELSARQDMHRSHQSFTKIVKVYARRVIGMLSALGVSGLRKAGKSARPCEP